MDQTRQAIEQGQCGEPERCILQVDHVERFKSSPAYDRIRDLLSRLTRLVTNQRCPDQTCATANAQVAGLLNVLDETSKLVDAVPVVKQDRQRFGSVSFRTWYDQLGEKSNLWLEPLVSNRAALVEIRPYFTEAFGSRQRLDYGTGHELSFLAFVGCLIYSGDLGDFDGLDVLRIFQKYFRVVRKLIMTYNLEPAGSHGVWGLDDHFHLPYILGSAQIVDISKPDAVTDVPVKIVLDRAVMDELKDQNLYFEAVAFVYKVKGRQLYEHSPILYDVTGVKTWHKVHRGMVKMYVAEVLHKFPVVQHFLFGPVFFQW